MAKNILFPLAITALLLSSCDEGKKTESANTTSSNTSLSDSFIKMNNPAAATNPENASAATVTANTTAPQNSGSQKLNPPHGQPGHDCALPVGAPLNSAGGAKATPATSAVTATPANAKTEPMVIPTPTTTVTPTPQKTAEGFSGKPNPAHGQPGHRCDIAEGATLP